MWKKITDSKWFYIVVSLLLTFVLWLYVGKEANPSVAAPVRGIKVTVAGLEKLEERGLMVSEGADQTITLDLQAKRNVFNRLDNENITITVDVSNINEPGEVSLDYKITYPLSVYGEVIEERGKRPEKIALTISRWTEKEVPVRAVLTGNVAEDYQQGEFSLAPQTVTVRGREELVEQIDYAQVTVSQEGMTETYRQEMPFVFIDRNGSPLEEEDASQLVTEESTILVTLPVYKLKEIPLTVDLVPGGGVTDVDSQVEVTFKPVDSIVVAGSEDDLEGLSELTVGSVDLYQVFTSEDVTFPVQLSPELTNVSGVTEVTVTVAIKGLSTKVLEANKIELINVPEGYAAEAITQTCSIQIRGAQEAVDAVLASQLRIVADLSDRTAGSQTVPVKVYLDGSSEVGVVGDYNIVVSITQ
ncbi:MAG: hypothetical protein HPZ90_09270 [Flavonifractor sp.]|nr:hypothetical protein [Flavonifractor sp.]